MSTILTLYCRHASGLALLVLASSSCTLSLVALRESQRAVEPSGQAENGEATLSRLLDLADCEIRMKERWLQFGARASELGYYTNYGMNCLSGYKEVPYHSMYHALNVFDFILSTFYSSPKLNRSQVVTLALAALCHDYGHPGLDNDFMVLYYKHGAHIGLSADEIKWARAIKENEPEKFGWARVGQFLGDHGSTTESSTYIEYPGNYDYFTMPILDDANESVKVFEKGCGTNCSSILESYSAAKASEIAKNSQLEFYVNMTREVILASDFGKDYWMRERLFEAHRSGNLDSLDKGFLVGLAMHMADIGGASHKDFLLWVVGAAVESDRQLAVGSKGIKFPETYGEFFESQSRWISGVGALFKLGFEALGIHRKSYVLAKMTMLARNKEYFEGCAKSSGTRKMRSRDTNETLILFRDLVIMDIIANCLADVAGVTRNGH